MNVHSFSCPITGLTPGCIQPIFKIDDYSIDKPVNYYSN